MTLIFKGNNDLTIKSIIYDTFNGFNYEKRHQIGLISDSRF